MVTASFKYCIVVFRHKIFLVILMFFVPFIPFSPYFGYVFLIKYDRGILDFRDEKTLKGVTLLCNSFQEVAQSNPTIIIVYQMRILLNNFQSAFVQSNKLSFIKTTPVFQRLSVFSLTNVSDMFLDFFVVVTFNCIQTTLKADSVTI